MSLEVTTSVRTTAVLSEWIETVSNQALPESVRHTVQRLLLDHLGSVIVGSTQPAPRAVQQHALAMYGGSDATIIGTGYRCGVLGAAFANGTAAHALESDDGFTAGASHPSAATMPAVLALAEQGDYSGERTLTALAVGIEVACRVAAAGHPTMWRRGFHNTALAGVFGAAAGCAALMGLDRSRTASALGVAGSRAAGLTEFLQEGTDVKRLHPGMAAREGLSAVDLSSRHEGLGPTTVFEGKHGYFAAYGGDSALAADLTADLGTRWHTRDVYIKPYPCCRLAHAPIDAVLELRKEHGLTADAVESIDIATYEVAASQNNTRIGSLLSAQMSTPYAVAVALCDGAVGLQQFAASRRKAADVGALMAKVNLYSRPDLDRRYPGSRPCEVRVRTLDGRSLVAEVERPLGEEPLPLADQAIAAKVTDLVTPVVGEEAASGLIDGVWRFESVSTLLGTLPTDHDPANQPPDLLSESSR